MTLDATWRTPAGHEASIRYRPDTSDWNTVSACLQNPMAATGDEYHLPAGLSGWALDVGAHIGAVTVGLLIDNPALRVVAIEAVPDNVELLRHNVERNGVAERATIVHAAAWSGKGDIEIEYGYSGSETADVHRWIGSVSPWMESPNPALRTRVPRITLREALALTDGAGFAWVKIDCEGCEHRFLRGAGLRHVGHIEGEWHRRDGSPETLAAQLARTHEVEWSEGVGGGPFRAVRR